MPMGRAVLAGGCAAILAILASGCLTGGAWQAGQVPRGVAQARPVAFEDEYDFEEADEKERDQSTDRKGRTRRRARRSDADKTARTPQSGGPWGVRAGGLLFPSTDFETPGPRILVGGFYRFGVSGGGLEIGFDLGINAGDPTEEELLIARANYLYFPSKAPWYLEAGGGAVYEIYNDHDEESAFVEIGTGYGIPFGGRRWDTRVGIWQMLASSNAETIVVLSVGLGL